VDVPAADRGRPSLGATSLGLVRRLALSRYTGVLLGIVAIVVFLSITEPVFLTWDNWQNIIRSQAVVLTLAAGMTFVVLTGGIDLSIASATVGASMILGLAIEHGAPWWLGCLAGIGMGVGFGLANGVMIGVLGIPFFVVTLGTLSIYQSIALLTTNGETISLFAIPEFNSVQTLINGETGPFPNVLLLALALYLVGAFVLHLTPFGRSVYAVGSNPDAARLTGINVRTVLVAVYAIAGLTAGFAAVVQTGRLTAAGPQVDPNLMLSVIAAVLIGGTAFTGGDGGLLGTAIGVMFLGLVQNGLQLSSVSTFWQGTVSGSILILAVGLGVLRDVGWRTRLRGMRLARARGAGGSGP
jgi:ribose/xylose/arabinose/galactoside ABC-type transport system permease subunit